MDDSYNTNYTIEEVDLILKKIQNCIKKDRLTVSLNHNRKENRKFINEYNINSNKLKGILLDTDILDFCYSVQNTYKDYSHETLYVFCSQKTLHNVLDVEEEVDIYIKFNIIENDYSTYIVTISFHKRNKPITYLFR